MEMKTVVEKGRNKRIMRFEDDEEELEIPKHILNKIIMENKQIKQELQNRKIQNRMEDKKKTTENNIKNKKSNGKKREQRAPEWYTNRRLRMNFPRVHVSKGKTQNELYLFKK